MEEYTLEELRELKEREQEKLPALKDVSPMQEIYSQEAYTHEEYLKLKHSNGRK